MSIDDDGQHDGDSPWGGSPFARSVREQPWMRSSQPPWHLWGNTQQITVPIETTGAVRQGVSNTLVRISYKRPETWHWLFQAKLISGPNNTPGFFSRLFVHWQLAVGIGRSNQRMEFQLSPGQAFAIRAFEDYIFRWQDPAPFPINAAIWTTKVFSPARTFDTAVTPGVPDGPEVDQIVAQDLQLNVQIVGLTVADNVAAAGQNAVVEVSAAFAPKTHVRPDWYQSDVGNEGVFAGDEVAGR